MSAAPVERREPARVLGVLGGMGPLATADFYAKLIAATPATTDQQHIPVMIAADPRIPDRSDAIREGREAEVLDALGLQLARLEAAGAAAIVMPCNTAHRWLGDLAQRTRLPFIDLPGAVARHIAARFESGSGIAVFATRGTVLSDVYGPALDMAGIRSIAVDARVQARVDEAIRAVKAGRIDRARAAIGDALARALEPATGHADRPDAILLACTELPVAARGLPAHMSSRVPLIDTTGVLAEACVRWWRDAAA